MALFGRGRDGTATRKKKSLSFDSADEAVLETEIENWVDSNRPKLGEVLLELGSVDPDDLINALQEQKNNPDGETTARLGEVLLKLGSIDETALAVALAQQFGVPFVDLKHQTPEPEAVARVPEEVARKHMAIPMRIDETDRIFLAIADPLDTRTIEELTKACRRIGVMMGTRSDIERLLDTSYNVLADAATHIQAFELTQDEVEAQSDDDAMSVDDNAPIVQVVNRIITQAVRNRASDVHIEPGETKVRVRYRVDGAMSEAITLPARMSNAVTSRIKVMAELNIVERRKPQDGQFGVQVDGRPVDIRTSTVPTVHGEKIVLRLLDKTKNLISLADLGMHPLVEAPYIKIVKAPMGMLLCTGPTGSGKTTTLYATLQEINDPTKNVVTIEDPVEYQFEGINQMPISDSGMSFADGLRGILRQDPDIILVGEIRDEETARIAMQASLTGHFVLSSLHSVDAVAAVHRFTDMGIEPFLVASAMTGVVGQRLLRKICSACKTEYQPTPNEIRILADEIGEQPKTWIKGEGCNVCAGTGYRGRVGVYELLQVTDTIRELIVDRASHTEMRALAIDEGMKTMQHQAFQLVVDGVTTMEDVIRSVYAPGVDQTDEELRSLPAGKRQLRRSRDEMQRARDAVERAEKELDSKDDGGSSDGHDNGLPDPIEMGSGGEEATKSQKATGVRR